MSKHPLYNQTGLQKNNKSHVLYALADKQMELKNLEEEYSKKIRKIKGDLSALEATICLFDTDCKNTLEKISKRTLPHGRKRRSSYFERGEAKKFILIALRKATEPLKTSLVALSCQNAKGITQNDTETTRAVGKIIVETLRQLEKKNLVETVGKDGLSLLWKIKD